jgi:uncharacterized protein
MPTLHGAGETIALVRNVVTACGLAALSKCLHAGWPLIDETIFMLRQHPGLYADVAVLQSTIPRPAYYEALRRLVDAGYADRIMVGSDGGVDNLREGIEAILKAPFLSDPQKKDILYNNAARFFRLKTAKP